MVDKAPLFDALRAALGDQLAVLQASAKELREGATHEEAKPENEYDTRALEQSYLAGAQTARAEALAASIASLELFKPPSFGADDPIRVGAAVVVDDGQGERRYLLCEVGGGTKVSVGGQTWSVLTPNAPLGRALIGKCASDFVTHRVRGDEVELEIIDVA